MHKSIARLVVLSRLAMVPLFLGLIFALLLLVVWFFMELWRFTVHLPWATQTEVLVGLLALIGLLAMIQSRQLTLTALLPTTPAGTKQSKASAKGRSPQLFPRQAPAAATPVRAGAEQPVPEINQRQPRRELYQALARMDADTAADMLMELDADAVTELLLALRERPLDSHHLIGASCHDWHELEHACAMDLDFAVVSPVRETASHPGAKALGFTGLRDLTERADLPVYALGGMAETDLFSVFEHGAQGIAAIRGLWLSP